MLKNILKVSKIFQKFCRVSGAAPLPRLWVRHWSQLAAVDVQNELQDHFIGFDTIPACDGQTDRQTQGHRHTLILMGRVTVGKSKLRAQFTTYPTIHRKIIVTL